MNDGTAFPFVMLGLGLLGHHDLGAFGWRWFAGDVVSAIAAGIAIGGILGSAMGRWVLYLRTTHREAVGLDDLLALGLIAFSYGAALLVHGYGFLAVFAAGIALRPIERMRENVEAPPDVVQAALAAQTGQTATALATDTTTAPGYMAEAALGFAVQLERIAAVAIVVVLGAMITRATLALDAWWFVLALFVVVRPLALLLVRHRHTPTSQRRLMAWFGIRGVGAFLLPHVCAATWSRGFSRRAAHGDHLHRYCRVGRGARCFGYTADAAIQSFARGGAGGVSARGLRVETRCGEVPPLRPKSMANSSADSSDMPQSGLLRRCFSRAGMTPGPWWIRGIHASTSNLAGARSIGGVYCG